RHCRECVPPHLLRREVVGPEFPHPDPRQQMSQSAGVVQVEVGQHQQVQLP
ncbi:hypothetical protein NOIMNB_NOIMNB_13320, partial [Dysosmobacter welbionis]